MTAPTALADELERESKRLVDSCRVPMELFDRVIAALRKSPPGEGGAKPLALLRVQRKYREWDCSAKEDTVGYIFAEAHAREEAKHLPEGEYFLFAAPPQAEQGTFHCKRHGDYPTVGPEDDPECPTCKLERKPQAEQAKGGNNWTINLPQVDRVLDEGLYNDLMEYFDDRSDADHDGERFIGNEENGFVVKLGELRRVKS